MKNYLLISAIAMSFTYQVGAMNKKESQIFRDTFAFVIEDVKKVHDMFFLKVIEKGGDCLGLNELNDIRSHHLELFDKKAERLSGFLKRNQRLLEQDRQKLDEKIELLISVQPGGDISKLYNTRKMLGKNDEKLFKKLKNYRDAIESGRPYRNIRKPHTIRSFFNDRWAIASVLFCTAYCAAVIGWIYHYKFAR